MIMDRLSIASLLLLINVAWGQTATSQSDISQLQVQYSTLQQSVYEQLSQTQQTTLAQVWGISPKEYSRYLWLMSNTENSIYYADRHLDPTWILAINAKDTEERRHFTLQAIKNERIRLAKLLAFQQEFSRLQHELYPNENPIASPSLQLNKQRSAVLQTNDILLFFTSTNNPLDSSINQLLALLQEHPGVRLNIYLVGRKIGDGDIQHWAAQHQIPIALVKQGAITLNHDQGRFNRLTQGKVGLPFTVLNHAGQFQAVDLNSLLGAGL
jgi:integrating conjugative element protein (TIGR03759 family)